MIGKTDVAKTARSTVTQRDALFMLNEALWAFRSYRDEVPLHILQIFLIIAQRRGISAAELAVLAGVSQSSISRNVQSLGRGRKGERGLGLVTQLIDPKNPRAKVAGLTRKGEALAKKMALWGRGASTSGGTALGTKPSSNAPEVLPHLHWQNWID